jgi:hypothetical protein
LRKLYLSDIDAGKTYVYDILGKENYQRKNYSVKWGQTE